MSVAYDFIQFMANSGALTFGDFLTKSGRRSPYFINTGRYQTGEQLAKLGDFYAETILRRVDLSSGKYVLFGPAYKGIPLAAATAVALAGKGVNVPYCFNRKEAKDHGEGGSLVGYPLSEGDRVLIVEDVITAGTAVRETLPLLQNAGALAAGLVISVDRMERGTGGRTAVRELWEDYGIPTYPIVTVRDILDSLRGKETDGRVLLDEETAARMEEYMAQYCAEAQG